MAFEWQTASVVSHNVTVLIAVKNYNKSLEKKLQDFSSRPRPRQRLDDPRPRLSFLSSRRLQTKTLFFPADFLW